MTRVCKKCLQDKPLDDYRLALTRKKLVPRTTCRFCENTASLVYRADNLETILRYNRGYYVANLEYFTNKTKNYFKAHPEARRVSEAKRRAQRLHAHRNDLTPEQEVLVLTSRHGVCDYCPHYKPGCKTCAKGRHILTIDHITALSRQGDHTLWNVVACCKSCNSKKGTKPPPIPVQPLLL